ncbi:MAG: glucan biosynthesis protein, partial [Methylobacteriaceae bacterium]|nr:glucan biosynthesis protein [Methylobacteriaceae bacterium]
SRGTLPFQLAGNIRHGGLVELAFGVTLRELLFDYGGGKALAGGVPANAGFAGFRLHYPINDPRVSDELISFLGASSFRFLGRRHRYGLSALGLTIDAAGSHGEEFPRFREFWVDASRAREGVCVVHALLDSPAVAGAYRFQIYPAVRTSVDIFATLFPRRTLDGVGLAPLATMYFSGENNPGPRADGFHRELHDSDGLLMHTGTGEWIWRPLRNPAEKRVSAFQDDNPRGFGLMQRDRQFESYQDLDALYHRRPSYWVEFLGPWGKGHIEMVEQPAADETGDNIRVHWRPAAAPQAGHEYSFSYNIKALSSDDHLDPGGKVINTFIMPARNAGGGDDGATRFIVDFSGGDLAYYQPVAASVELVPTTTVGAVTAVSLVPNEEIKGFRASFDVRLPAGETTDLRAYLKSGTAAVTETWTYPFSRT